MFRLLVPQGLRLLINLPASLILATTEDHRKSDNVAVLTREVEMYAYLLAVCSKEAPASTF